jgi:hypothetical protein
LTEEGNTEGTDEPKKKNKHVKGTLEEQKGNFENIKAEEKPKKNKEE